jgi:hypothetical protein
MYIIFMFFLLVHDPHNLHLLIVACRYVGKSDTPPNLVVVIFFLDFYMSQSVAPLLCPSVGVKPNTWKSWELESFGTPECSELDNKGQNTSHWGVLGVIEKS